MKGCEVSKENLVCSAKQSPQRYKASLKVVHIEILTNTFWKQSKNDVFWWRWYMPGILECNDKEGEKYSEKNFDWECRITGYLRVYRSNC